MKKVRYLSGLVYLISCIQSLSSLYAQPTPPDGYEWQVVEELTDEFGRWDASKWWKPLWDYGVPVKMLDENSGVEDGKLWFKATLREGEQRWFGTSRVMSYKQISYPMYTECSMKSAHMSAYNTFWLNNGDINNRDEIDICENNSKPTRSGNDHWPYYMQSQYFLTVDGNDDRAKGNFDNRNLSIENPLKGIPWNEAYHTLGAYWVDDQNIQFYLDGEPAGKVTSVRKFSRELNIIWDLWTVDEHWSGGIAQEEDILNPENNTMQVDWIHTYKLVAPVTGISTTETISTGVGQFRKLIAYVEPSFATNDTVRWTSRNENIVTVDANGKITGVAPGQATISAITNDGNFTDETVVTVQTDQVEVLPSDIEISSSIFEVAHRNTIVMESKVYPVDATEKGVIWSSSDSSIAHIDNQGILSALLPGEAEITVSTINETYSDTRSITVNAIDVTGIVIENPIDSLEIGSTYSLTSSIEPTNASDTTVIWRSNNSTIASIDDQGNVTGHSRGFVRILAVSNDNGLSDEIQIRIVEPVLGLNSPREITLHPNPVKNSFIISGTPGKRYTLQLFDLSGKSLFIQEMILENETSIDLSTYPSGTYTLDISWASGRQSIKLIKE